MITKRLSDPAVDLRPFMVRRYDVENFDSATQNVDEQDVLLHYIARGDGLGGGESFPYSEFKIDRYFLVDWVRHQFLKQVFNVTFDPYYLRDGLLHKKSSGFGDKSPEYDVPKCVVRLRDAMLQCDISRRYNDQEVF